MATKSVFLYGKPTNIKLKQILEMQNLYTKHINFFIETLINNKQYYLDVFNNNKKSPIIRLLEKDNRTLLGSALGQNAIDHAVKELHNHFVRIRNYIYGLTIDDDTNYFISSISLLNACIQENTPDETINIIEDLKSNTKDIEKLTFYDELLNLFKKYSTTEIQTMMNEVKELFFFELQNRKIPTLNKTSIQLDSRLFTIEEAKDIKADFIISIKSLERGKRIEIPITTSKNSLRRLKQYGMCSPTIKIVDNKLKVIIPFEKKIDIKINKKELIGIDIGITDLIYTSEGNSFGNYSNIVKHYEDKVMPKLANRNNLQNLMKQYQKELRDKTTPIERKEFLRKKIFNINKMLQGNKHKNRVLNSYYHKQDSEISSAIKEYIKTIKDNDITTVIEDIDIINFDRGKKSNRRDSMWARGQLLKKLENKLIWHSKGAIKVDPAYTSKLCPKCFNIDDANRKGKDFKCSVCGHSDDADHNASINIKERAFDKEVSLIVENYKYNTKKRHEELKKLYQERHKLTVA